MTHIQGAQRHCTPSEFRRGKNCQRMHIPHLLQIKERRGCFVWSKKDEILEAAIIYLKIHINREQIEGFGKWLRLSLDAINCVCASKHTSLSLWEDIAHYQREAHQHRCFLDDPGSPKRRENHSGSAATGG